MEVTGLSGLESSVVSHSLKGQPIHFLDGLADFTELLAHERISQLNGGKRPLGWVDFRKTGTESGPEFPVTRGSRSEEHTSELQSLMRISYAVFCLKKKKN